MVGKLWAAPIFLLFSILWKSIKDTCKSVIDLRSVLADLEVVDIAIPVENHLYDLDIPSDADLRIDYIFAIRRLRC